MYFICLQKKIELEIDYVRNRIFIFDSIQEAIIFLRLKIRFLNPIL